MAHTKLVLLVLLVCSVGGAASAKTSITSDPTLFKRGQSVIFSATFRAPLKRICSHGQNLLALRLYNVDDNSSPPTVGTKYLAAAGSNYDYSAAAGTITSATFEPITIPDSAGDALYADVWSLCPFPKTTVTGKSVANHTFRFHCGTTTLCAYSHN